MDVDLDFWTVDVTDAFLMVRQPEAEKTFVDVHEKLYRLGRVLPGQRTAASRWFDEFKPKSEKHGLECDVMQPTLTRKNQQPHEKGSRLYVTIHVDDLLVIGDERAAFTFLQKFEAEEGWKLEKKGPFGLQV
jgi:hypothetical protein